MLLLKRHRGFALRSDNTATPFDQFARTIRAHWPEYLMEAWGLGTFMISVAVFATLLEFPGLPVHELLPNADLRRALMGLAMGLTAIGIIYSPWGQQSGAHLNPAVTLAFMSLGKVKTTDAVCYIAAQFAGGVAGSLIGAYLMGRGFTEAPVQYAVTTPSAHGVSVAFAGEALVAVILMTTVLIVSNAKPLERFTGLFAGGLVAVFIYFEAPFSGMSMNPARSFASALPASVWTAFWVYMIAPPLGMLIAAQAIRVLRSKERVHCAKLLHPPHRRCIHCGYEPSQSYTPLESNRLMLP